MNTTTSPAYRAGITAAEYQLAGLTAAEADTVRAWRRSALDRKSRVRDEVKAQRLAGFARACSDFLGRVTP